MSLADYEDFVFGACHVDEEDAAAHWRAIVRRARRPRRGARRRSRAPHRRARHRPARSASPAAPGSRPTASSTCPTARSSRARSRPRPRARSASVPGHLRRARGRGRPPALRGGTCRRRRGRAAAATTSSRCSTWTPARGCSARSPSGSTTRSTASRATSSSTRRSAARCTSRSARASRRPAARTARALHWDMICDLRDGRRGLRGRRAGLEGRPFPRRADLEVVEAPQWLTTRLERLANVLVAHSAGVEPGDLVYIDSTPAAAPLVRAAAPAHPGGRRAPAVSRRPDRARRKRWSLSAATTSSIGSALAPRRVRAGRRAHRRSWRSVNTRSLSGADPGAARPHRARPRASAAVGPRADAARASYTVVGHRRTPRRPPPRRRDMSLAHTRTSSSAPCSSARPIRSAPGAISATGSGGWRSGSGRCGSCASWPTEPISARGRGQDLDRLRRQAQPAGRRGLHRRRSTPASKATIRFTLPGGVRGPARRRTSSSDFEGARSSRRPRGAGAGLPRRDARARRRGPPARASSRSASTRPSPTFTGDTLFDEKIGGTVHLALGDAYPRAAARTSRLSTGTWSATCAPVARSMPTASSSTGTAGFLGGRF